MRIDYYNELFVRSALASSPGGGKSHDCRGGGKGSGSGTSSGRGSRGRRDGSGSDNAMGVVSRGSRLRVAVSTDPSPPSG